MQRSSDARLTIINEILDFSKIEAGKLELESIPFNLRATVEEALDLLAVKAHAKGLELVGLVYADVHPTFLGDPGRLRQILINLVGNAVQFTEMGEVTLKVSRLQEMEESQLIRLEVSDTGVGIPSEALPHLFQSFSQADGSTTRTHGGTGHGLAICKHLIHMMGGEIGVSSKLGEGSQFWVTLPLKKTSDTSEGTPVAQNSLKGIHVCAVDDNSANLRLLQQYCALWGIRLESAENGVQALALARAAVDRGDPFDLVICDMHMPGMDGRELARCLKADSRLATLQLVLLTSLGQRGEAKLAKEAGFSAYLTKPVHQSQLYQVLSLVLGKSSGQQSHTPDEEIPLITRHTLKNTTVRSRAKILLAEDNVVNQKVAARMLEKLGFGVDLVTNGKEAVEVLSRTSYDLVLMDCQMPEMDGYEATAEIRRREASHEIRDRPDTIEHPPHIPIIALTANAMKGDREKCLEAGMDDFISKPVDAKGLQEVLHRWLQAPKTAAAPEFEATGTQHTTGLSQDSSAPHERAKNSRSAGSTSNDQPILDPHVWKELQELGGEDDASFVTSVIEQYLHDAHAHIDRIQQAVIQQDPETLVKASHSLKGSSRNIGAKRLAKLCAQFEQKGRSGQLSDAQLLLPTLKMDWQHTRETLSALASHRTAAL